MFSGRNTVEIGILTIIIVLLTGFCSGDSHREKIDVEVKVIPGTADSGKTPDSQTPIRIASIEKPRLVKKVKPKYPGFAKKARIQGKVNLDIAVDIYGRVIPGSIQVLNGHPLLRQAAVDAVKQWIYEPYIKKGVPKSVRFTLVVDFSL